MNRFEELLKSARWDAYRDGRHCHQRRRAFVCDAYKSVKGWRWSFKPYRGFGVLTLSTPDNSYATGIEPLSPDQVEAEIQVLSLEALRDVARATKDRLDGKPSRP